MRSLELCTAVESNRIRLVGEIWLMRQQFFDRGVSVLHLIANPFPPVWHSLGVSNSCDSTRFQPLLSVPADAHAQDDASALSLPALKRWCRILRVFVAEYLDLAPEDMKRRDDAAPRRDERDELVRTDED